MSADRRPVRENEDRQPVGRLVLPVTRPQGRIVTNSARHQWITTNRRFGKTVLGGVKCLRRMQTANPFGLIWWIAPTYRQARPAFKLLLRTLQRAGLVGPRDYSRQELRLSTRTGWSWEARTADNFENLRGDGPDEVIVDEARLIPNDAWYEVIYPALADHQSPTTSITTPSPDRKHWHYIGWSKGQAGEEHHQSYHFTAYDSIFIPRAEIEHARANMSDRAFRQEFLAEVLDGTGVVFEGVRACRAVPVPGEPVGIGADWAKKRNYSWFAAVGAHSGAVLEAVRQPQKLAYDKQGELLGRFVDRYRSRGVAVVHDRTGVGEAIDDILYGLRRPTGDRYFRPEEVEGFAFTERSKTELVEETIVDWESGRLGWIEGRAEQVEDYERAIKEHEDFALTVTKRNKIVYGAPEGLHDDAVDAVMLARRAARKLEQRKRTSDPRITVF